jgi:hypothetical protein
MDISVLQSVIPADLSDNSRVWIYQSSRPFIEREESEINEQLHQFYTQWQAHGAPVKGWAKLLFRQFVVIIADETDVHVSGCSTDASVRAVKSIERQYEVNMFDRMMLTFLVKEKAEMLPLNQIAYAMEKGYISMDTPMFNNLVNTKADLMNNWLVPIKDSWLASRLTATI